MYKYILGLISHIFNHRISIFARVDNKSIINKRAKINRWTQIYSSLIDCYTYIGPKSEIIYAEIGKFCSIADGCSIGLPTHSLKNISTSPIFTSKRNGVGYSWTDINNIEEYQKVIIGNDVWIGTKVIIMGGVKIGNGAIVGAGSIVTKDIPRYAIAVGIPARVIRYRFEENIIRKLEEIKWWDLSENKLKSNIVFFQKEHFSEADLEFFCCHLDSLGK